MFRKISAAAILVTSIQGHACIPTYQELLVCTNSQVMGAPTYTIVRDNSAESEQFFIRKTPINPMVDPEEIPVSNANLLQYGETFIFTVNHGRSGYAHFYKNGDTSLIDINLFMQNDINTKVPLTNYTCEEPEPVDYNGVRCI